MERQITAADYRREESRGLAPNSVLNVENEQAGTGRNGRTSLAKPNYQARTGTVHFPIQLTTSRIGNLNRLMYTLLKVIMAIHTLLV